MTHNRIWAAVCFLLSIVISIMVVAHSFFFLNAILEYHWIIIALALSTIELAYISLPYIAKRNEGFIKYRYLSIIVALFLASVIPATLQTTKDFRGQLEEKIVVEPTEPIKSPLIGIYQGQLDKLDIQIIGNQDIIKDMIAKRFVTKSADMQEANKKLSEDKTRLSSKQEKLEEEYQFKKDAYDKRLDIVSLTLKKQNLNYWFDVIKLTWSLLVIFILQLANAAFVHHGSQLLIKPNEEIYVETPEIVNEKEDDSINTNEGTKITVDSLLDDKFKVSGVGRHRANVFLDRFKITTFEQLSDFVFDDGVFELIRETFASETATSLNRMVRKIKRTLEAEAT